MTFFQVAERLEDLKLTMRLSRTAQKINALEWSVHARLVKLKKLAKKLGTTFKYQVNEPDLKICTHCHMTENEFVFVTGEWSHGNCLSKHSII